MSNNILQSIFFLHPTKNKHKGVCMFKKVVIKSFGVLLCVAFAMVLVNTNFLDVMAQSSGAYITYEQINQINQEGKFGKLISTHLTEKEVKVGNQLVKQSALRFKLFGLITIKEVGVNVTPNKQVYVGGIPLGFALQTKGVIVIGENSVLTEQGDVITQKSEKLLPGDIITSINDTPITSVNVIVEELEKCNGNQVKLQALRKDKNITVRLKPALDLESQTYKLGLWVRDDASGIGTLTYVDRQSKAFGALGHPITDYETGAVVPVLDGKIYNCTVVGINKGVKGKPGELRCLFMQGKNAKGTVSKNTTSGVFGKVEELSGVVDENLIVQVGGRLSVKAGPAKIISSVSGVREEYDIEIIKAVHQSKISDKSIIFRVKDKRLLSLTGGILQGMSGSPIVQDGVLVGAVTHVFLNDPTKGYGIYLDWMLAESA
jgi:stage IV sporulation protein B